MTSRFVSIGLYQLSFVRELRVSSEKVISPLEGPVTKDGRDLAEGLPLLLRTNVALIGAE